MRAFGKHGVKFSDKHFSQETLEWILHPPQVVTIPARPPVVPRTPQSAFDIGWAQMLKDPEVKKAVVQMGYTKEKGFADFSKAVATPLSDTRVKQVTDALKVDYVTKVEDGNFIHLLNGKPILSIPTDIESAAAISLNVEAIIYGIFIAIDVISVVCTICNIYVSPNKGDLVRPLTTPLKQFMLELAHPFYVAELKRLKKAGEHAKLCILVLRKLNDTADTKLVLKTILGSMSPADWIVIGALFLGTLALLIASGGTWAGANWVVLAGMLLILVADVISFIQALGLATDDPLPPGWPGDPPFPPWPPDRPVDRGYFIGNSNTMEIHNLYRNTPQCLFELIKEDHKVHFETVQDVGRAVMENGYNGCHWCMPQYDTG